MVYRICLFRNILVITGFLTISFSLAFAQNPLPSRAGFVYNAGNQPLLAPLSVFVSGNYAYVASSQSNALEIVDVTNPALPVHKGSLLSHVGGALLDNPYSVFVAGNYAYVASYNNDALEIIEVSNPSLPVHKGSIGDNPPNGALLSTPSCVYVSGNYAYVVGPTSFALEIVDVTNPALPLHKGSVPITSGKPYAVFVSGNYAYVASQGGPGLVIVDVSNPATPVITGSISDGDGGAMLIKPYAVYVVEPYAYVASSTSNALEIVDITNKSAPVHKGSIVNGSGGAALDAPRSLFVSGDYAYLGSQFSNALEIVNVHDPAAPVHAASFSPSPDITNPHSVFVSGNYAYVAGDNGLEIVAIFMPPPPRAEIPNVVTDSAFTAKWDPVVGATGYFIDVSTDNFSTLVSGFNNAPQSGTAVNVPRINGATPYQYRVRAANANGSSTNSNVIEILATPIASATDIATFSFTANWTPVSGATNYTLVGSFPIGTISTGNVSSMVINPTGIFYYNKLLPNQPFSFSVQATSAVGISAFSSSATGLTIPGSPTNVGVFAPATLTWSIYESTFGQGHDQDPTQTFFIDVATDSNFTSMVAPYNNLSIGNATFVLTDLNHNGGYYKYDVTDLHGNPHYYRVRSGNATGVSGNSNVAILTFFIPPPPVAEVPAVVTDTSFTARWDQVTGATGYFIDVSTDNFSTFVSGFNNSSQSGTSVDVPRVNGATPYQYRVRAANANGSSTNSNVIEILATPIASATDIATFSFTANWTPIAGATNYFINVPLIRGSPLIISAGNVSSIVINPTSPYYYDKLLPNAPFSFSVQATGEVGFSAYGLSAYSSSVTGLTTPGSPIAGYGNDTDPSNPTWSIFESEYPELGGFDHFQDGSQNFFIDIATDPNFSSMVAPYNNLSVGNATFVLTVPGEPSGYYKYNVIDLPGGNTYYYRLRSGNKTGVSDNSNVAILNTVTGTSSSLQEPLSIFPNPSHDFIFLRGIVSDAQECKAIDMLGKETFIRLEKQQDLLKADIHYLSGGVYLLSVSDGDGVHRIKFIKQ